MEYEIVKEKAQPLVEKPKWTLKEVVLSKSSLDVIDMVVKLFPNKDVIFNELKFYRFLKTESALGINFFGIPGTGKSITAEAIAHELGMSIIRVNYGGLVSSFQGKTSRNLKSVFKTAEETNSLLFFDEADAVLGRRISNLSQAADHDVNTAKNTLCNLLDQFNGIVVFATNLFGNYDEAFLRRILFHIEFEPPTLEMREHLWRFHLSENIPKEVSYEQLATISNGLCGGDIRNITIRLGLLWKTGKIPRIDEPLVQEEIENNSDVKLRHMRRYEIVEPTASQN